MKDNIILRKIWQDDDVVELTVVCSSPIITATSEIYVSDMQTWKYFGGMKIQTI